MTLDLVHISPRPGSALPFEAEVRQYLKQTSRWYAAESRGFATENAFGSFLGGLKPKPGLVLCDPRGRLLDSDQFGAWMGARRDAGLGRIVLAIGPADGWSQEMLRDADLKLAFGPMTMPHALARLVLAEQIYRAATILARHPYHLGH